MTIQNTPRISFITPTTGGDLTYPFSFKVFDKNEVLVYTAPSNDLEHPTRLEYGTDYTVTLNPKQEFTPGGTVTLVRPVGDEHVIVLVSDVEPDQDVFLTNYGGFYPAVINGALDKLTALIQDLREQTKRAVTLPYTSKKTPEEFKQEFFDAHKEAVESAQQAKASEGEVRVIEVRVEGLNEEASRINETTRELVAEGEALVAKTEGLKSTVTSMLAEGNTLYANITKDGKFYEDVIREGVVSAQGKLEEMNQVHVAVTNLKNEIDANASDLRAHIATTEDSLSSTKTEVTQARDTVVTQAGYVTGAVNDVTVLSNKVAQSSSEALTRAEAIGTKLEGASATIDKVTELEAKASASLKKAEEVTGALDDMKATKTAFDTTASQATSSVSDLVLEAKQYRDEARESAESASSGQIQADWTQADTSARDYIRNKPTAFTPSKHTHSMSDITGLSLSWDAITGKPSTFTPPAKYGTVARVAWGDIDGTPATVTWSTLSGKPSTFPPPAKYGTVGRVSWADIDNTPATVTWSTLSGKPSTFPPPAKYGTVARVAWGDIDGTPATVTWGTLSGKPSTFPPSAHRHNTNELDGLSAYVTELVDKAVKAVVPPGTVVYMTKLAPGFLLCNGAEVPIASYPDLYEAIKDKVPPASKPGYFKVYDMNGRFIESTTDTAQVGKAIEAGLPNITGSVGRVPVWVTGSNPDSGALSAKRADYASHSTGYDARYQLSYIALNASSSNRLYGASTTVQPASTRLLPCIKT